MSHPMRLVTVETASSPDAWTPEKASQVAELFDSLAPEWHTRDVRGRLEPVEDAFARGGQIPRGVCLEIGSGIGIITPWLAERFEHVLALELSIEMLKLAPPDVGLRVHGDASVLPLPDASVDCVVLMNSFLFVPELHRVLRPEGAVVWISSRGPGTPIYLPAEDVDEALGTDWDGVASAAGEGTWSVFRRRLG